MANIDLKKLNRKQLLELLLKQTKRVEELQQHNKELEQKLEDRTLVQQEIGSIAEASLKINGVFEAAEAAAAQYLNNVIDKTKTGEGLEAESLEVLVKKRSEALIHEIESKCREREAEADRKIEAANKKIEEAERMILKMKSVRTVEKNEEQEKKTAESTGDVLNDFFSSVIGK